MIDIDHFKLVNDRHGHVLGDHVLQDLSKRLQAHLRREQLLARYGGEEFVVVLPDTDPQSARQVAEALCELIADAPFEYETVSLPITVSIGVATADCEQLDASALITNADENLYRAKRQGRNRVVAGRGSWPRWKTDIRFAINAAKHPVVALSLLGRRKLLANNGAAARVDDLEGLLYAKLIGQRGGGTLCFGVLDGHLLVTTSEPCSRSSLRARTVDALRACVEEHGEARFASGQVHLGPRVIADAISTLDEEVRLLDDGQYLPQPIALGIRALEDSDAPVARAKRVLELGESVLQWLAMSALSEIVRTDSDATRLAARNLVGPIAMGKWHEIFASSSKELMTTDAPHVSAWRATFANKGDRAAVLTWFNELVSLRNNFSHEPTANDEHVVMEIVDVRRPYLLKLIREDLRHVLSLVAAEIESVDFEDDLQSYKALRLIGERPPVPISLLSRRRMRKGLWLCDLVADRASPLEPLFLRDTCPKCGARELFLLQRVDELTYRNPFTGHVLDTRLEQLKIRDDDKDVLRRLGAR